MLSPRSGGGGEDAGERGLVSNAGALLGSRVVMAVLGWAGTVLIAQSLSADQFGQFTLVFTVLGMMSIVTDMGIARLAVKGMLDEDDTARFAGSYVLLRTVLGVVGYGVALLVMLLGGYPMDLVGATAVAGIVVLLATPSAALDVVFQARQQVGRTGAMGAAGTLAQVALTAALAAAGGTVLLFCIPAVLAQVVVLAWKVPAARRLVPLRLNVDLPLWRRLLREALPLTIGFGLLTLYSRVDALMLSQLATFTDVGIYGVSYKFVDIMHYVGSAVTVPLLTLLVLSWPHDPGAFRDAARRASYLLGAVGGLALTGLLAFAEPLTSTLYGAEYAPGADATRLLALAELFGFGTALAMACLVAADRHRGYPVVILVGLVLNVVLNIFLIPAYGYDGAAVATLASNVVVVVAIGALVRRMPGLAPWQLGRLVAVLLAAAVGVVTGIASDQVLPWPLAAVLAVVTYSATAWATGLLRAADLDPSRLFRRTRPGGLR